MLFMSFAVRRNGEWRPHAAHDSGKGLVLMYSPAEIEKKIPPETFPELNERLKAELSPTLSVAKSS